MFVSRHLRQVPQGGDSGFAAQHLGGHSLDVARGHVTWTKCVCQVKPWLYSVHSDSRHLLVVKIVTHRAIGANK